MASEQLWSMPRVRKSNGWRSPSGSLPENGQGESVFGYMVEFKVNSRNRFGTYTGKQKRTGLIRDGEVIPESR